MQFPATQSASGDANALDDYEEGTWTPTDQSGATLTLSSPLGNYTKIGRIVFWQAQVTYPATADTSAAIIGGLPFTVAGGAQAQGRAGAFLSSSSASTTEGAQHIESTTTFRVLKASAAANTNAELSEATLYLGGFFVV